MKMITMGSSWSRIDTTATYQVLLLANEDVQNRSEFPLTVVYRSAQTLKVYSLPADIFLKVMRPIGLDADRDPEQTL
jgi:hypothetical protein